MPILAKKLVRRIAALNHIPQHDIRDVMFSVSRKGGFIKFQVKGEKIFATLSPSESVALTSVRRCSMLDGKLML